MSVVGSHVGQRMVVRHVVTGQGPSGGQAMSDVVGRVLAVDETTVTLERRNGTTVVVPLHEIVAAKVVPAAPVRSRRAAAISTDNLTRITSLGWPAVVSEQLGEWELRASAGFTGRANSVAVTGDPGMPGAEAVATVEAFYSRHRLPPLAQAIVGSEGERLFVDAGWAPAQGRPGGAIVQVAQLVARPIPSEVTIAEHASDEWLALYNRVEDPAVARAVLEGPATVGFASIDDLAIGRVVVTGEWAGLSGVEVARASRRQGLAGRIVDGMIAWACERGADKAYLQTMSDNTAALALYERYDFETHHEYIYLAPHKKSSRP